MAKNLQSDFHITRDLKPVKQDQALEEFYEIIEKN